MAITPTYSSALLDQMMMWEDGELDSDDEIDLFQHLVDTGLVWELQGMYGRRAEELLRAGAIYKLEF